MTLSGSETGISYQLKNSSNANVQAAKAGTGSVTDLDRACYWVMDIMWLQRPLVAAQAKP